MHTAGNIDAGLKRELEVGGVDLCTLLLNPEHARQWREAADSSSVEMLLLAEPEIGSENAARVLRDSQIESDAVLRELGAEQRAWLGDMVLLWRRQRIGVSEQISPNDGFHRKAPKGYFQVGWTAVRRAKLAMIEARITELTSILDFGCNYGRVLRTFKAAFPSAELTACDVVRDAVDFCAEAFDAVPVYSDAESTNIPLEGPFDLIWAGSVFSHFDADDWNSFLRLFETLLAPKGLLVFTAQGRRVATGLRKREFSWPMPEERIDAMLADYSEQGFGYRPYPAGGGLSLAKPSWACAELDKHGALRLLGYREHAWGYQDVISCMRADERELALTSG